MIRIKRLYESNQEDFTEEDFNRWLDGESNPNLMDKLYKISKTFSVESGTESEYFLIAQLYNFFYALLHAPDNPKKVYELEPRLTLAFKSMDGYDAETLKREFDFYNTIVKNLDNISDYLTEIEDNGFKWNFNCYQEEFSLYDILIIRKGGLLRDDLDKLGDTIKIVNTLIKRLNSIPGISDVRIDSINNWSINIYLRG
jgi:hypothetical protein